MTRGVVSEGERGEAGGGCRGDANNAGVHQPGIVHLDIYFSAVDVANGRIRVRGSGPLPRNGFTVDRSVYCIHTPHTTVEMGTLSTTILRRKYWVTEK